MKKIIALFLIVSIPLVSFSQKVQINSALSLDIDEVRFKKTTKGGSGLVAAKQGTKFLVIDGTIYSSVHKKIELQLYKLILNTDKVEYMALADVSYIPYSILDRYIRVKKKAKKKIYFQVDENFKEGVVTYNKRIIGKITLPKNSLRAEFTLLE